MRERGSTGVTDQDVLPVIDLRVPGPWRSPEELTERLALEGPLHGRVMRLDLRYSILYVLRSIANRGIRQQVEIESDTGELVEMVHGLRANNFLG